MRAFSAFALFFCFQFLHSQETKLSVTVSGIQDFEGKMQISLYNIPSDFTEIGKEYKSARVPVISGTVNHTWKNLPRGDYAICLYHDQNSDGVCNTNWIGIPNEYYGFSNNIVPRWSSPSFSDCKFSLSNESDIRIKLISFW